MDTRQRGRSLVAEQEKVIRQSLSRSPHHIPAFNERANALGLHPPSAIHSNSLLSTGLPNIMDFSTTNYSLPLAAQFQDTDTLSSNMWPQQDTSVMFPVAQLQQEKQMQYLHENTILFQTDDNGLSPTSQLSNQFFNFETTNDSVIHSDVVEPQHGSQPQSNHQWLNHEGTNDFSLHANTMAMMPSAQFQDNSDQTATQRRHSSSRPREPQPALFASGNFQTSNPYAHSNTLDPTAAMGMNVEWQDESFRRHRRNLSETYSDGSSHASPRMPFPDDLDPSYDTTDVILDPPLTTFDDFTLSGHPQGLQSDTPHISSTNFDNVDNTLRSQQQQQRQHHNRFPTNNPFSELDHGGLSDMANAAGTMSPPDIKIDLAPQQQTPLQAFQSIGGLVGTEALSPPMRTPRRVRARSDPYVRVPRETSPLRSRSPSLVLPQSNHRSQSVNRTMTSSLIVDGDLAPRNPGHDRDMANGTLSAQPATTDGSEESSVSPPATSSASSAKARYQCDMCTKRFTRKYNLHSHKRTHTNERPFSCAVCDMAFARQHDKKRHEGLHSGEKRYVCRGTLAGGVGVWGCGRGFARADALGRHFRSEAGRACIRPLLDEEIRERRAALQDQQDQDMLNNAGGGGGGASLAQQQQAQMQTGDGTGTGGTTAAQMRSYDASVDVGGITLPAALLQMYPALAGMDWTGLGEAESGGGGCGNRHGSGAGQQEGMTDASENDGSGYDYDGSGYSDYDVSADEGVNGYVP